MNTSCELTRTTANVGLLIGETTVSFDGMIDGESQIGLPCIIRSPAAMGYPLVLQADTNSHAHRVRTKHRALVRLPEVDQAVCCRQCRRVVDRVIFAPTETHCGRTAHRRTVPAVSPISWVALISGGAVRGIEPCRHHWRAESERHAIRAANIVVN